MLDRLLFTIFFAVSVPHVNAMPHWFIHSTNALSVVKSAKVRVALLSTLRSTIDKKFIQQKLNK